MIDLDAYLDRIRWGGSTTPTLATLTGILRAHMEAVPFENLDVLLHRPISLALDDVQRKLVRDHRGGYCFEHATLFAAVLEALGYDLARHLSRVVLDKPRREAGRSHMFLVVALLEGSFVVDPGFGGPAASFPVPLVHADETSGSTHWMEQANGAWVLRTPAGDGWATILDEAFPVDFVMSNHFSATHPNSRFVNQLAMSRFTPKGRITVLNRNVRIRTGSAVDSFELADRAALRTLLVDHFGFDLPVESLQVPAIREWQNPD